jgi:hypothetical protein
MLTRPTFSLCILILVPVVVAQDLWAEYACVYHYDGRQWQRVDTPALTGSRIEPGATAMAVEALGQGQAWVVGAFGSVHRYDGTTWQSWPYRTVGEHSIVGLAALDWDHVYAASDGGGYDWRVISYYDGAEWSYIRQSELPVPYLGYRNYGITAADSSHIWVCAEGNRGGDWPPYDGYILRCDGTAWGLDYTYTPANLLSRLISASGPSDVWACRSGSGEAEVYHYDGTGWQKDLLFPAPSPDPERDEWYHVYDLSTPLPDSVWICGENYPLGGVDGGGGAVWRFDGEAWSRVFELFMSWEEINSGPWDPSAFLKIAATSDSDVWALAHSYNQDTHQHRLRMYHYNGVEWSLEFEPTDFSWILDLDAAGPDDVWLVGSSPTPEPATLSLLALGGALVALRRGRRRGARRRA